MSVTAAAATSAVFRKQVPKRLNYPKGLFRHVSFEIILGSETCRAVFFEFPGL